jgi:hypothetical protein
MKAKKTGSDRVARQKLMKAAKAKGIAYFRILNKAELAEALKPGTTAKRIAEIQKAAVRRWQSGWKFRKPAKRK